MWTGERGSERYERCTMEKHIFILKSLDAAKNTMLGLEFVPGIFNRKDKCNVPLYLKVTIHPNIVCKIKLSNGFTN